MKTIDKPYFYELNSAGIAWVRDCLEGGRVLSKIVLSKVSHDNGKVFIAIATPEHNEAAQHNQPLRWGTAKIGVPFYTVYQTAMLFHALKQLEEKYGPLAVAVEDDLTSGDPKAEEALAKQLYKVEDQYLNIKTVSGIMNPKELINHLEQSIGYPLNAFVIPEKAIPDHKNLSGSDIEGMASSVLGIINFAYDGETYTLWIGDKELKAASF